ncbi:MAG: deoxyribodipyrimidine photo-lyase [Bacteroidetes bacterium]|nr:deoxyribodipyrimidine photo-lyase [Bacteroidota bacterium]
MEKIVIHWFRRDLRLADNAALYHALKSGYSVLPIFVFDKHILDQLENKDDKRVVFIHQTIAKLKGELEKLGSSLFVYYGSPDSAFDDLISKYQIEAVYTNHDYEPYAIARDSNIENLLKKNKIQFHSFKDQVIFEKKEVVKDDELPYTVFTPYSKKWKAKLNDFYLKSYPTEKYFTNFFKTEYLPNISLQDMGFNELFVEFSPDIVSQKLISNYSQTRDIPSILGTSRLGIHFRFGTISIRQKAVAAMKLNETYLNELIWREFYMQILWHFPQVVHQSFRSDYDKIRWVNNEADFKKWCDGKTGIPIVDAGMRELNETGYMHNRVRMIVASFLTKNLLIDWRWGEAYFAQKLLDFELASNNGGWQWAAGSGTDAAPYFRVFNPILQAEKFDPQNIYIKKWVKEYGTKDYIKPIVDLKVSRDRCLEVYKEALKG